MEGQIVVPVSLAGACPSLRLAILMAHKTDQINKQPFCRVRLAQCPADDPETGTYIWGDGEWQRFPWEEYPHLVGGFIFCPRSRLPPGSGVKNL